MCRRGSQGGGESHVVQRRMSQRTGADPFPAVSLWPVDSLRWSFDVRHRSARDLRGKKSQVQTTPRVTGDPLLARELRERFTTAFVAETVPARGNKAACMMPLRMSSTSFKSTSAWADIKLGRELDLNGWVYFVYMK